MSYPETKENFLEDLLRRKEFYSLKADPERNFRDPPDAGEDILAGKYLKIHSHQLFVRNFMNPNTPYKRLHLMHACHPAGTEILMYDGMVKNVEDIVIGDKLAGDDGTPRNVLQLVSGYETIYRIHSMRGDEFFCNKSHIITFVYLIS
jgi:hypothetical protein